MSYFGGKIKNLPRFRRKAKPKENVHPSEASRKIGPPMLMMASPDSGDHTDYWMHQSQRFLGNVAHNLVVNNPDEPADDDSDVSTNPPFASEQSPLEQAVLRPAPEAIVLETNPDTIPITIPEAISQPNRSRRNSTGSGRGRRSSRFGSKKKKGKKGKKTSRSSSCQKSPSEISVKDTSASASDQKSSKPKKSGHSRPTMQIPLKLSRDLPFDLQMVQVETRFTESFPKSNVASPELEETVHRVDSITCSVSDHPKQPQGNQPPRPDSTNSTEDLDSILVCYIEPEELSCIHADASDFGLAATVEVQRLGRSRNLEPQPANISRFEELEMDLEMDLKGSVFKTPEYESPGLRTPGCEEPNFAPKSTGIFASDWEGATSPDSTSEAPLTRVVSVRKSRFTYPSGQKNCAAPVPKRESLDLKSIFSCRSSRESLMNLCGMSFDSALLSSPRVSLRLDFPLQREGSSALLEAEDCVTIFPPLPPVPALPSLPMPPPRVPLPNIPKGRVERPATPPQLILPQPCSPPTPDTPEANAIVEVDSEGDSEEEAPKIGDQKEEKRKSWADLGDESESKNQEPPNKKEEASGSASSKDSSGNVCTKMEKDWWEFDSEGEQDEQVPACDPQNNDSDSDSDNDSDNDSSSSSDSDDSSDEEGDKKSIFRQGNSKSEATDLFSECFDSAPAISDEDVFTCVEDTSLYKLIFPEEKELPLMFQSRGFMEEISSFVEKSNAEAKRVNITKPAKPLKVEKRAGKSNSKVESEQKNSQSETKTSAETEAEAKDPEPEIPIPEDDGKTSMVDVKNATRSDEDAGQDYIESCQQIFVNGASFWMQTELLVLQMEDAVAIPLKDKKKEIKFEEDIDANCPQIRISCDDDEDEEETDSEDQDLSKWDLRPRSPKPAPPKLRGCLKQTPKVYLEPQQIGCHSKKVGFKILANLMENVENMGKKLSVTCRGKQARQTIIATLKEFELILLNVKHFEVDVNYESIIRYIKRMLRLRRRLGEILSLTCGLQTEYVMVAEAIRDDQKCMDFGHSYWINRLQICVQKIRDSRRQLGKVKVEIKEILKSFTEKTMALFKQSRKILKIRDDLLAQYQKFILANHVNNEDLKSSLESLRTFKEFSELYSTICTDGFKRLLWDDINVLDKSRMIFENINKHFGETIKRQHLTLRGLQKPNELCPCDHRSKYQFRREISLLKKQRRARRRQALVAH